MDLKPICHPSPPKKMKRSFLDYVQLLMICRAGRWTQTPSTAPLQPKKWNAHFLDYTQLLMIGQAEWWTQTPSTFPLQPKKWNAHFWITFNFWWLAGLVEGLKPHPPPISSQKKWNPHLWITLNFWWSAGLVDGLKPHLPPLSSQKNEMLIFGFCSTSDDQPGWSMNSNPICHPSPARKWNPHFWIMFTSDNLPCWLINLNPICHPSPTKKIKCSIFNYVQLLMISQAVMNSNPICHTSPANKMKCSSLDYIQLLMIGCTGRWTWTPSTTPLQPKTWNAHFLDYAQLLMIGWAEWWTQTSSTIPLQPKKWNAHFWIMFNFWWSAGLVNGLKPHPPPLSSQKSEMLIFVLHSTSDVGQTGQWTWTSSTTPLQPKIWNAHFWVTLNFWWLVGLFDELKPHPPPLCSLLIFGLRSTSDDQPGLSMDSNPIHHPSPANKMKCFFFYYVHFWWSARLVDGLKPHPPPLSSQRNEMLIFWLCSTSVDWPGWSMDLNPICQPSAAKKMKCYFLDYVQLLMISRAVRWTQTPSATSLQPIKWNAHFWITFNFWWLAGLVDGLKTHPPPLSSQRNEMLIFVLCSTSNDRLGWSMDSNPIHHCFSAKNVKCPFFHYILHLMLARLVNGLEPHPPPLSSQKKWNPHFWVMFNFWWLVRLFKELKPHLPPLSSQ